MVVHCPVCGKQLRTTKGMRSHVTLMHKDKNDGGLLNNSENHNGNGYDLLKDEVAELKDTVEEIKWSMKGFVKFAKRKKMTEEELTESRGNFADCLNELKERGFVK